MWIKSSKNLLFLGLLLVVSSSCSSLLKKGKESLSKARYMQAVEYLETALKQNQGSKAELNGLIGEAYRRANRIEEAEPYYKVAIDANSRDEEVRFYYGYALKAAGKYQEAKEWFEKYTRTGGNSDYIRRAKSELTNFDESMAILETKTYYEVDPCPGINSEAAEYGPVFADGQLYVTTTRRGGTFMGTGGGFSGIYAVDFEDKDRCKATLREFAPGVMHMEGANEGTPAFAKDGSFVIFARSSTGEKGEGDEVYLYISRQSEAGWSEPEILPYTINISQTLYEEGGIEELRGSRGDYWTACPTITPDGKRLYFASNRPGGYGGTDIWSAEIRGTRITNVRNLGNKINTLGDEMFPYVSDEAKLFFASDGHPGIGGLDIFEAVRRDGKITIQNMGVPLNSVADDFAFVYDTDTTGYLSSNREGGQGDDDVYRFRDVTPDKKIVNYFLAINVVGFNPEDSTRIPLPEAKLDFYLGTELHPKEKLHSFTTNQQGKIDPFPVELHTDYFVSARYNTDYLVEKREYTTRGKQMDHELLVKPVTDTTLELEVILEKIVISEVVTYEIEINFDFNEAEIRPDAAAELDKFVIFLEDNPTIEIELGSHTDAVGPNDRNKLLSERRARSTKEYLVSKGIDPTRITAVGYGEEKLKIDTPDPEEQNRRTEFKIINVRQ